MPDNIVIVERIFRLKNDIVIAKLPNKKLIILPLLELVFIIIIPKSNSKNRNTQAYKLEKLLYIKDAINDIERIFQLYSNIVVSCLDAIT